MKVYELIGELQKWDPVNEIYVRGSVFDELLPVDRVYRNEVGKLEVA